MTERTLLILASVLGLSIAFGEGLFIQDLVKRNKDLRSYNHSLWTAIENTKGVAPGDVYCAYGPAAITSMPEKNTDLQ